MELSLVACENLPFFYLYRNFDLRTNAPNMAEESNNELLITLIRSTFKPGNFGEDGAEIISSQKIISIFKDVVDTNGVTNDHIYSIMKSDGFSISYPPGEPEAGWCVKRKSVL